MSLHAWISKCAFVGFVAAVLTADPATALGQVNWRQLSPATSPPARYSHAMAYDASRARTVVFGGFDATFVPLADTWEWDGVTWTQSSPALSPPARAGAAMEYDAARGRIVLYGGSDGSAPLSDTWEWDGANWTFAAPATSPPARQNHAMSFDPSRNVIVLFGGADSSGALSDTWIWNGTNWFSLTPATTPAARIGHAMAYDPVRGRILMTAGVGTCTFICPYVDETWEWDGTDWTQVFPTNMLFSRDQFGMVYDTRRGRMIAFGGFFCPGFACFQRSDTWLWDGSDWTEAIPAVRPSDRNGHAMVYDSARGQTLLFGGTTFAADTWVIDGPVSLTSVAPSRGSEGGGDWISLYGSSFTDRADSSVSIGGAAAVVLLVEPGRMLVRTPAGTGDADVIVRNSSGSFTLPGAFTYVAPEIAARFGNVNAALGDRENPILINGNTGDLSRELLVRVGDPVGGFVSAPSSLATARFCVYAWLGSPNPRSLTLLPRGLGLMVFPTPFAGTTPQPRVIFNNLGFAGVLGTPTAPSSPAPSTLFTRPGGVPRALTVAFQGLIRDDGAMIPEQVSVTNAVIVRFTP